MKQISVIIPVYNSERYLSRCIGSVLEQTYTKFELILVDDGSYDLSAQICDEYQLRDNRIKVIHQINGGVSAARNAGLQLASGDYVTFVDSDDWIAPDFLDTAIRTLCSSHADIFLAGHYRSVDGKITDTIVIPQHMMMSTDALQDKHIIQLLEKNYIASSCGKVYSRAIIGPTCFPIDMNFGEDLCFLFSLLHKKSTLVAVPSAYYYYCTERGKATSLTTSISKKRCQSTVATYQLLLSLPTHMQLGQGYLDFINSRWVSDLLYVEDKILNSELALYEKYSLLRVLLRDRKLRDIVIQQNDRYLHRYAARPAILLAHRLYNNAKSSLMRLLEVD